MSKTTTYNNPFSEKLMSLINGVYSTDETSANKSFKGLLNYFNTGSATTAEVKCLIMTNQNYVVKLIYDIKDQIEVCTLLRTTVGAVVADALSAAESEEDHIDVTGDTVEFI